MKDFRCPKCKKLLFKYKVTGNVSIEIKCPRCSDSVVTNLVDNAYTRRKFIKGD